jgi:hypothetical protein
VPFLEVGSRDEGDAGWEGALDLRGGSGQWTAEVFVGEDV